jgi:hypothetical protein
LFLLRVRVRKRHRALGMKPRLGMASGTCRQASGARPPWRDNRRPRRVTRHMEKSQSRRISGRVAETPKPCIRKIAGSGLKSLHRPAKWRGAQIPTSSHQVALPRWHRAVPRWKHSDTGESAAWGRVGWGEGGLLLLLLLLLLVVCCPRHVGGGQQPAQSKAPARFGQVTRSAAVIRFLSTIQAFCLC